MPEIADEVLVAFDQGDFNHTFTCFDSASKMSFISESFARILERDIVSLGVTSYRGSVPKLFRGIWRRSVV